MIKLLGPPACIWEKRPSKLLLLYIFLYFSLTVFISSYCTYNAFYKVILKENIVGQSR